MECGKRGVWKMLGVENAGCGKFQFQYEMNKYYSFIFSLKKYFIKLWHLRVKRINARSKLTIDRLLIRKFIILLSPLISIFYLPIRYYSLELQKLFDLPVRMKGCIPFSR